MRRKLLMGMLAASVLGCTNSGPEQPVDWNTLALTGKRLTLQDPESILELAFQQNGFVNATFGIKGGAVAGPILYWKITGNTLVIFGSPDTDIIEALSAPTVQGDTIRATQKSGVRASFHLSRW